MVFSSAHLPTPKGFGRCGAVFFSIQQHLGAAFFCYAVPIDLCCRFGRFISLLRSTSSPHAYRLRSMNYFFLCYAVPIDLCCRFGRFISLLRSTSSPHAYRLRSMNYFFLCYAVPIDLCCRFGRCHGIRRVIIGVRAYECEHSSALTSAYSTAYFTRKTPG